MTRLAVLAGIVLMPLAMCAQQTIVLRDGTQFSGRMTGATPDSVMFRDDRGSNHRFDITRIDSLRFNEGGYGRGNSSGNSSYNNNRDDFRGNDNPGNYQAGNGNYQDVNRGNQSGNGDFGGRGYTRRENNRMTLASGTEIAVRTNESIDSSSSNDNRFYTAVVNRDVVDDRGNVVIPRGSDAQLVVRRLSNDTVALDLQSISVNGQRFTVDTADVTQQGTSRQGLGENRRTAEFAGGGALLGTLLGAIAGGGKGAAIGALAGGAAGVGAQVLTRGGQVHVPAETELTFRLDSPMNLRY